LGRGADEVDEDDRHDPPLLLRRRLGLARHTARQAEPCAGRVLLVADGAAHRTRSVRSDPAGVEYGCPVSSFHSGTVTFAFTDIEGSTKLLQELGDEAFGGLSRDHRRLVRETFGEAGGTEVDTQGDAFFFSFPRARDAVNAAVA